MPKTFANTTNAELLRATADLVPKSHVIAAFHAWLEATFETEELLESGPITCPVCEASINVNHDHEANVLCFVGQPVFNPERK